MLSADASVFVPRHTVFNEMLLGVKLAPCEEYSEEAMGWPPGHGVGDELCSTSVPSLAPTAAGDLAEEQALSSPFWGYQESPHWDGECMDNFGGSGMPGDEPLQAPEHGEYAEVAGELGDDPTFAAWAGCVDPDLELAASDEAGLDLQAAGMEEAAALSLLSMWGCLEDAASPAINTPFASSCELARQLAPRPEGVGDAPLLIHAAGGGALDGHATLAPIPAAEGEALEDCWSFLAGVGSDDYVQKVCLPEALLRDVLPVARDAWWQDLRHGGSVDRCATSKQKITVKELHEQLLELESAEENLERLLAESDGEREPAPGASPLAEGGAARGFGRSQGQGALAAFDGFLFSEAGAAG